MMTENNSTITTTNFFEQYTTVIAALERMYITDHYMLSDYEKSNIALWYLFNNPHKKSLEYIP